MKTRIIIPARLASKRLPGKPLADIAGVPMILRVAKAARSAGFGEPLIAAGDQQIFDCAKDAGFEVVLTSPDLPSGTDRVQAALELSGFAAETDIVVNLQGDLPMIAPKTIQTVVKVLQNIPSADIATLVAKITEKAERTNADVVKAVLSPIINDDNEQSEKLFRALYFTRTAAPYGDGTLYHHIGIYAYRRKALEQFTKLKPSILEKREKLEQLRALENNMQIAVGLVDEVPQGVDNPQDLEKVRVLFGKQS
ncbi:MAG: 3-deoxy-manno-octulosonate cytidylyltransferase [Robiginitomaculum sp.]|nr:3-deoxy-manno-octulosonate cytidylyltransferase [Robiginitomaculum sp.]MBL4757599.1 3-deoxy-manno-octulosonate cytidylyltransferase [Hyphomicrobiales bacterium]